MLKLSPEIKDRLKSNWGDRMHSMACYAEIKIIDPKERWGVYLLAMNPEDEDEVFFMGSSFPVLTPEIASLRAITEAFNDEGEYPILDNEFRRVWAAELFKRLGGQYE